MWSLLLFVQLSYHLVVEFQVNPFRQALEYAITLGGHSNTIASMTGALCGAYYDETIISSNTLKQCEGYEEIKNIAQDLYNI